MPEKRALRTSTFLRNFTLFRYDPAALLHSMLGLTVLAIDDLPSVGTAFDSRVFC
jgi:hypothetical protein